MNNDELTSKRQEIETQYKQLADQRTVKQSEENEIVTKMVHLQGQMDLLDELIGTPAQTSGEANKIEVTNDGETVSTN